MRRVLIFLLLILGAATFAAADPISQFDAGLAQYRADNWEQAISIWEELLDQGYESGALHYNLGNAYYRLNNLGKAVLEYERAERLLPRDADVRRNLEFIRLRIVDRIEDPIRLSVWGAVDRVRDGLTLRELSWLLILCGVLLALVAGFRLFGPGRLRENLQPALFALVCLYVLSGAWYVWRLSLSAQEAAIIMNEIVEVYSGPDDSSTQLFQLHEGTKIAAREQLADWMRIRLADGREGWLKLTDIEVI